MILNFKSLPIFIAILISLWLFSAVVLSSSDVHNNAPDYSTSVDNVYKCHHKQKGATDRPVALLQSHLKYSRGGQTDL